VRKPKPKKTNKTVSDRLDERAKGKKKKEGESPSKQSNFKKNTKVFKLNLNNYTEKETQAAQTKEEAKNDPRTGAKPTNTWSQTPENRD
jgi:hypothetical protein